MQNGEVEELDVQQDILTLEKAKEFRGNKRVKKALKYMRKAGAGKNLRTEQLRRIEAELCAKNHSSNMKGIQRIDDIVFCDFPLNLKPIEAIKSEAKANFALTSEIAKIHEMADKHGKPRKMYTELLEDIRKEQSKEQWRKNRMMKRTLSEFPVVAEAQPTSIESIVSRRHSFSTGPKPVSESISKDFDASVSHVTKSLSIVIPTNEFSPPAPHYDMVASKEFHEDSPDDLRHTLISTHESSPRTNGLYHPLSNSNLNQLNPFQLNLQRPMTSSALIAKNHHHDFNVSIDDTNRPMSSTGRLSHYDSKPIGGLMTRTVVKESDQQIIKVKDFKEQLQREREEANRKNILAKYAMRKEKQELRDKWKRQRAFLVIVSMMAWLRQSFTRIFRARQIKKIMNNSPRVCYVLTGAFRRFLYNIHLNKRRRSADLLLMFMKAAIPKSSLVKKMYSFYRLVTKTQRIWRGYLEIQRARLQLLMLAFERTENKMKEIAKQERQRVLKLSAKSLSKVSGFEATLSHLDSVQIRLQLLLDVKLKKVRKSILRQKHADNAAAYKAAATLGHDPLNGPHQESSLVSSIESYGSHHRIGNIDGQLLRNYKHQDGMPSLMDSSLSSDNNSIKSNHRESMYDGKAQHRALIKKINLLRDILRKQRRRHWLAVEESRKLSKRTMKFIDVNAIRQFLKNPQTNEGLNLVMTTNEFIDKKETYWPPFLLLTQGGLDAIDALPASVFNINMNLKTRKSSML